MGKKDTCCPVPGATGRYNVEAIVSVDERGQMVLPKELRKRAMIDPGDKLAAISLEKDGKVCCIMLIRAEQLVDSVKTVVGSMVEKVL